MSAVDTRLVRITITMPDEVFTQLDQAAGRARLTRSEFFRSAGLRYAADLAAGTR